jgi:hypothetical protein
MSARTMIITTKNMKLDRCLCFNAQLAPPASMLKSPEAYITHLQRKTERLGVLCAANTAGYDWR